MADRTAPAGKGASIAMGQGNTSPNIWTGVGAMTSDHHLSSQVKSSCLFVDFMAFISPKHIYFNVDKEVPASGVLVSQTPIRTCTLLPRLPAISPKLWRQIDVYASGVLQLVRGKPLQKQSRQAPLKLKAFLALGRPTKLQTSFLFYISDSTPPGVKNSHSSWTVFVTCWRVNPP